MLASRRSLPPWRGSIRPDDGEALPLDVCFVLRDGSDVTLVTWDAHVKETLEAADALAADGISAEVIDVATLKPLDFDTIPESVQKNGRCVLVHDTATTAGNGAEIDTQLAEQAIKSEEHREGKEGISSGRARGTT